MIASDALDESFVARRAADATEVRAGDELVVLGGATRATVLNPTGALVWECLDGTATLGELIDDLAAELPVDEAVVRADVMAFASVLGAAGLLDGVAPAPDIEPGSGWEQAPALEVGDAVGPIDLVDLDRTPRPVPEIAGADVLLVNWSPTCGFCVGIAGELALVEPVLRARGVELVLLTVGDADTNRALLEPAGLAARARLRVAGDDPFGGTGTPAAYHLAADGTLRAPMVLGAIDVPRFAAELGGVDDADGAVDPDDGVRHLPVPAAMCGPGGGATGGGGTEWVGTRAYAIGGYHVGLAYNTDATATVLDSLFPGARVDDARVGDNYSVALAPATGGAVRDLHLLVEGGTQLVRSRSAARVLRALLWRLSFAIAPPALPAGGVLVDAGIAVRGGEALLLPRGHHAWLKQLQPRLGRAGVVLADVPAAPVDLRAAEVVIPEPTVPYDAAVLHDADADTGVRLGSEAPAALPGRYAIRGWLLGRPADLTGALTPGVAAVAALPWVAWDGEAADAVTALVALFERVPAHGVLLTGPDELASAVVDAFVVRAPSGHG